MKELSSTKNKKASIIIVSHCPNAIRYVHLRYSLRCLVESLDYPAEIIVIDNSYVNGIKNEKGMSYSYMWYQGLRKKGYIQKYIGLKDNYGISHGRNIGFKESTGDYIVITDDDMFYKKGWLSECVELLDKFPNERLIATSYFSHWKWRRRYFAGTLGGHELWSIGAPAGSVFRRKDFEALGEWDTSWKIPGKQFAIKKTSPMKYKWIHTKEEKVTHEGVGTRSFYVNEKYFNEPPKS